MGKQGEVSKSCFEQPSCHACLRTMTGQPRDYVKSLHDEDNLMLVMFTKPLEIAEGLALSTRGQSLKPLQISTQILGLKICTRAPSPIVKKITSSSQLVPGRNKKYWIVLWWCQPAGQPPIWPPQMISQVSFSLLSVLAQHMLRRR